MKKAQQKKMSALASIVPTASTVGDQSLLNKIDKLFTSGVGEYVSLPQIVAVGDQSSGKSSVLEAICGLPFPRDSGLCTRFATQIRFRRATTASTVVSIIPASNASPEHVEACKAFRSNPEKMEPNKFTSLMKEVSRVNFRKGK